MDPDHIVALIFGATALALTGWGISRELRESSAPTRVHPDDLEAEADRYHNGRTDW